MERIRPCPCPFRSEVLSVKRRRLLACPCADTSADSILNTGDAAALDALPGIGTVLSERIVAYREEHGAFVYPEELRNVKGIGEKRLQAILDALAGESAEESD